MSYEVGTFIDLTYLNKKKPEPAAITKKRQSGFAYDTGTQLIFKLVNGRFVTARKINVAFA